MIRYALTRPGHLTINIFDIQGARIRRLADRAVTIGEVSLEWDGRDYKDRPVPTGVYWIRVTGPIGAAARKVIKVE